MAALGSDLRSKGVFLRVFERFLCVFCGAVVVKYVVIRGDLPRAPVVDRRPSGFSGSAVVLYPLPPRGGILRVSLFFRMVCAGYVSAKYS
jgi:hypothetical protein